MLRKLLRKSCEESPVKNPVKKFDPTKVNKEVNPVNVIEKCKACGMWSPSNPKLKNHVVSWHE